jgi:hypothetical protein
VSATRLTMKRIRSIRQLKLLPSMIFCFIVYP